MGIASIVGRAGWTARFSLAAAFSAMICSAAWAQVVERNMPPEQQPGPSVIEPPNAVPTDQDSTPIGPALRAIVLLGPTEPARARVADGIDRRAADFLAAEVGDTGKPAALASTLDVPRGAANFKVFADIVKNVPTESFQMTTPDGGTAVSYAVRSPPGVVAVICPWNLPLLLMTWKVGAALACGNTVIVKPSEETPATATLLGEVMNAVGVPKGVYQVLHGFGPGSAGEFLTKAFETWA